MREVTMAEPNSLPEGAVSVIVHNNEEDGQHED
jgi:hypothetical protein